MPRLGRAHFQPPSPRLLTIDPEAGSTFLDAEHVVILMQENRSFDHAFGTLQGVRGFNDPRAITLPDGNPVWVQTECRRRNAIAPFRLNIKDTNATWMGCLPHCRTDQVDARNQRPLRSVGSTLKRSGDAIRQHAFDAWATTRARTFRSTTRWPMPSRSAISIFARP